MQSYKFNQLRQELKVGRKKRKIEKRAVGTHSHVAYLRHAAYPIIYFYRPFASTTHFLLAIKTLKV